MRGVWRTAAVCAAVAAMRSVAAAQAPSPDLGAITRFFHDVPYTAEVATPHIPWAKALGRDPIHVFAIATIRRGRDVNELAQRLNATFTTVTVDPEWRLNALGLGDHVLTRGWRERHPPAATYRITDDYLRVLVNPARHYDCYVVPTVSGWNRLPDTVRATIIAEVERGAGLVLIRPLSGPGPADELNRLSPLRVRRPAVPQAPEAGLPGVYTGQEFSAAEPRRPGVFTGRPEEAPQRIDPEVGPEGLLRAQSWRLAPPPERDGEMADLRGPHYIARNVPLDLLPVPAFRHTRYDTGGTVVLATDRGDPILAARTLGRGRVVALAYDSDCLAPRVHAPIRGKSGDSRPGLPPERGDDRPTSPDFLRGMETAYSLLCRAIVWASQQEATVHLRDAVIRPAALHPALHQEGLVGVTLTSEAGERGREPIIIPPRGEAPPPPGTGPVYVRVTVRSDRGRVLAERHALVAIAGGDTRLVNIPIPMPLDGGRNVADILLTDQVHTADWGSLVVPVERWAAIERLDLAAENRGAQPDPEASDPVLPTVLLGERITGTATVTVIQPSDVTLTVTATDRWDRVLARQVVRERIDRRGNLSFSLRPQASASAGVVVSGVVEARGQRCHEVRRDLLFRMPREVSGLSVVMWEHPEHVPPAGWRGAIDAQWKALGVTTVAGRDRARAAHSPFRTEVDLEVPGTAADLAAVGAAHRRFQATGDPSALVRVPCLSDPALAARVDPELTRAAHLWAPFSPTAYRLTSAAGYTPPGGVMDLCFGPHCLADLRTVLKHRHGDLRGLGDAWGTVFRTWDEVMPDTLGAAVRRGRYAGWLEHRRFSEDLYARWLADRRGALRAADPFARTVVLGADLDAGALGGAVDAAYALMPPDPTGRGATQGQVIAGPEEARGAPEVWRRLLEEQVGRIDLDWRFRFMNPDLTLSGVGVRYAAAIQTIRRRGFDRLILGARRDDARIAIHVPPPSVRRLIDRLAGDGTADQRRWTPMGRSQEEGRTDPTNPVLGYQENLDAWTALLSNAGLGYRFMRRAEIEEGALWREGCRVLILPMSWSLTPREVTAIRAFVQSGGCTIADARPGQMDGEGRWMDGGLLDDLFGIRQRGFGPDRPGRIDLTRGERAPGDGPNRIILHRVERGRTAYIGAELGRPLGPGIDLRPLRQCLGLPEPDDPLFCPPDRAAASPWRRIVTYRDGSARYLANPTLTPRTEPLDLDSHPSGVAGRDWHIYDSLASAYLGHGRQVPPAVGAQPLIALLPYRATDLAVVAPERVAAGGNLRLSVRLSADRGLIGRHVVAVDLVDPAGRLRPEYHLNLDGPGGLLRGAVPLALNDPPGAWTIRARDAATGMAAEARVTVEPPE